MTIDGFRRLALSFSGAIEARHMNHPDFRAGGRIFATLSYPAQHLGMVKLTLEQQADLIHDAPEVFTPVPGGWGRQGCTHVRLRAATKAVLLPALEAAWRNATRVPPKSPKPRRARIARGGSSR